jgi:peptidoglycan/LPS O-acetylase OafA/YrhL
MAKKKNVALEAVRGVAALVVVVFHICLGFFPYYAGEFPEYASQSWQGEPFFVFLNGHAAVALFFVLSGYVLSRRFFESGDHRILLKGAVKRWPRLMGPVLLVVLASYALFKVNFYQFEQAGAVSGSPWLINFAHVHAYDNKPPIQLWYALREGAFLTFFRGDSYFDSAIWTMQPELIGSFITFGLAPILFEARKSSFLLTIGLIAFAAVLVRNANTNLLAFPIGVGLAALIPRGLAIPSRFAYPALLVALYFLGYSGAPTGIYALLYPFLTTHTGGTNVIGAALLIAVIETFPSIREVLSGRISLFLGALSFPIYLVHVLIICSAGSAVYLWAGALPAAFLVFIGSILVSLPLMAFNNWWITRVNAATDLMTRLAK